MATAKENGWSLPAESESLWAKLEAGESARRRGLSLREIVAAGVLIADREGIERVSMARIAEELGFATMALYRHVPSKSILVTLMLDAAFDVPMDAIGAADGWRARTTLWADGLVEVYRRHPWLLEVPVTGPPATPNNIRALEVLFEALKGTPFTTADKVMILSLIAGYTRGHQETFGASERFEAEHEPLEPYGDILRRFITAERHPELTRVVAEGAFDGPGNPETDEFAFGLERILDGLEILANLRREH